LKGKAKKRKKKETFDIYSYLERISSLMLKRQKIGLLLWDKLTVIAEETPPFNVGRI